MNQLLVGTYTDLSKSEAKGLFYINPLEQNGYEVQNVQTECISPSFICRHGNFLYTVNERPDCAQVSAYCMEKGSEILYINSIAVPGADTCHLQTDQSGENLYAANYTSGSLFVCGIHKDGSLLEVKQYLEGKGSGADKIKQDRSHMHCTQLSPDGRYLFAADLGTDRLYSYKIMEDGTIMENPDMPYIEVSQGEGPRQLLFSSKASAAWLITEMGCKIHVLSYDAGKGILKEIQSLDLLDGYVRIQNSAAAQMAESPDGKYLYASVRYQDVIIVYSVRENGMLERVEGTDCFGKVPRHFTISADGEKMLIANQGSDEVVICKRNIQTGLFGENINRYSIPKPVCIMEVIA